MRSAMIGAGYVGLVSGACFAEFGVEVCVVDTDADKVTALRAGRVPIYEPGLEALVAENVADGRLTFTTDLSEAVAGADAVVLLTEWNEFRALAPERLRAAMRGDAALDLRNAWDPQAFREAGFRYEGVGRG